MVQHVDGYSYLLCLGAIIPLWLKPHNRFTADKSAIDLSPCRILGLVSRFLVNFSLTVVHPHHISPLRVRTFARR
ncbi:MAG: hypothetical protein ACYTXC_25405 [Nostoc sp.]